MASKIVFITGATSGIGKATAYQLASKGYKLILNGRRKERLDKISEELKTKFQAEIITLPFDVRNNTEVENAIMNLPERWKEIDVLVNNAGLASGLAPIHEGLLSDWDTMIDTNVKGLLYVTRVVAPGMVQRKAGHIINVSSIAGLEVYPNGNVYCATKHAVEALTKGMRIDLLPYNIRVTAINPGLAETEFSLVRFHGDASRAEEVYKGYRPLHGEDVAETIVFAIESPAHVQIGQVVITPRVQAGARDVVKNQ